MNLLLAVLGTLRLTRFITTDSLGEWWFVGKARKWAGTYENLAIERRVNEERSAMRRKENAGIRVNYLYADGTSGPDPKPFVLDQYDEHNPWSWQAKLVKGLDCPFCVGFWLGAVVLLSLAIARAVPPLLPAWRWVMGAFALNYVTGHVSARLD